MKGKQRLPLWLICDVAACLRLHLAIVVLAMAVRRFLPRYRPPTPEGIAWITVWQACCESLLRWVIARQAFRLCGLDPKRARTFAIGEAASSFSWYARNRSFLHMYDSMTAIARRWAKRIKTAMAAKPPRPSAAVSEISSHAARVVALCIATPAGQRIRAPPWPPCIPDNTSPAPCRSTGEVAGVCAPQRKRPAP
jgi:hypothetical protein